MVIYKIVVSEEVGGESEIYPRIYFDVKKAKEFAREIQDKAGWDVHIYREIPDEENGFFQTTNQIEF